MLLKKQKSIQHRILLRNFYNERLNFMKKIIVTTTIQAPTRASKLFSEKEGWEFIVVGDTKHLMMNIKK